MGDPFVRDFAALVVTGVRRHWPQKAGHPGWRAQHPTPSLDAVAKRTGRPVHAERQARSAARYRQALATPGSVGRLIDQELGEHVPEFDTISRMALLAIAASSEEGDAGEAKAAASSRFVIRDLVHVGVEKSGATDQLANHMDALWEKWRGGRLDGRR